MADNFTVCNGKKSTFTATFSLFSWWDWCFLTGYLLQLWAHLKSREIEPQYIPLPASPWECPATLPAAPSPCVLSCCYKKMLDCSSVGAPGLRGSQAGREHRQGKCRQEAKWPCGLTGASGGCPARSEWQQCPWLASWEEGTTSPVLCQQPSVSASRRGGGKQFYFTLVYIGLWFFIPKCPPCTCSFQLDVALGCRMFSRQRAAA